MWTVGRVCHNYICFGNFITFYKTYPTNLFNMPFGLFVGVSNHFQGTIFGGVVMSDEKVRPA